MSDIERSSRASDSVEDAVKRAMREVDPIIPKRRKRQRPPVGVLREDDLTMRPVLDFGREDLGDRGATAQAPSGQDPRFARIDEAAFDAPEQAAPQLVSRKRGTRVLRELLRGVGVAVLVLIAVTAPFFLMAVVGLWLLVSVSMFLVFGAERVWIWIAKGASKFALRLPRQGAGLFMWLDGVAYRWDLVLDRFPDGSVDRLYMPDFATCHQLILQERQAGKARL